MAIYPVRARRTDPVSLPFNIAVQVMAARMNPGGWNVSPVAPSTFKALQRQVKETGRVTVWSGASENTIFGDPEINYAFRAWHDAVHVAFNLPFTMAGERAAAYVQAAQLVQMYGDQADTAAMVTLLFAEVIGQAAFYETHGEFPQDQRRFTLAVASLYASLAEVFVRLEDVDERQALDWAAVSPPLQLKDQKAAAFTQFNPDED